MKRFEEFLEEEVLSEGRYKVVVNGNPPKYFNDFNSANEYLRKRPGARMIDRTIEANEKNSVHTHSDPNGPGKGANHEDMTKAQHEEAAAYHKSKIMNQIDNHKTQGNSIDKDAVDRHMRYYYHHSRFTVIKNK